jgi:tetratricopeptide (TPR) repeat protein
MGQPLQTLLQKLPRFTESRMVSNGIGLWIAWKGELNQAVPQTLADYGGMLLGQEHNQSLWFFFSNDVILALARLEIWVRFNQIPVFVQIFPAKLLLGFKLDVSLSLDNALANQEAIVADHFEVWVHPKVMAAVKGTPGLNFNKVNKMSGLANVEWTHLQADPRLPYQSSMGWFLIFKALGNPLDKAFQAGWREFFPELEVLFKRHKLQFLLSELFVILPLDNLRTLRAFCNDYLHFIGRIKEESPEKYWPCVSVVVERKGMNFNAELPKKVSLDWEQLMPDFPHMSYKTAFLLGTGFHINDVRFSMDQSSVEDWCNVTLSKDTDQDSGALQVELPKRLVMGRENHCFYCGLRSHPLTQCPSRGLEKLNLTIWEDVAQLDFADMNKALGAMDKVLAEDPELGKSKLLTMAGAEGLLMRSIFEINAPVQHRMMLTVWASIGKDYPRGLQQLVPLERNITLEALDSLREGELIQAERTLNQAALKNPRDYKVRTLQGFTALERGDLQKAQSVWKEAETLTNTPLQQALHVFLLGRLLEIQGKLQMASSLYKQVLHLCPRWLDALYRQGVCLVKMGFAEQAMSFFEDLFQRDPHMFNRVLIDSELERGHLHLLSSLYAPWSDAETRAGEEKANLDELAAEIGKWFDREHPVAEKFEERIMSIKQMWDIQNYVAFNRVVQGRQRLAKEFMQHVDEEAKRLKLTFQNYMERLKVIQGEASWFPFPRILVEFNKEFNYCARNLNWALTQHFQMADNFRKALTLADKVEERLKRLESQLKTLKIVRDSTLFLLIMSKTFFWLEIIGLVLGGLFVWVGIYYAQELNYSWAVGLDSADKFSIQKGLTLILSISVLAISALRSALIFDSRKEQLFRSARQL